MTIIQTTAATLNKTSQRDEVVTFDVRLHLGADTCIDAKIQSLCDGPLKD